jgi:hypothetical protein
MALLSQSIGCKRQPGIVVLAGNDLVGAGVDEELRPALEFLVVETRDVSAYSSSRRSRKSSLLIRCHSSGGIIERSAWGAGRQTIEATHQRSITLR